MRPFEKLSLVVQVATLIVLYLTLRWLKKYTKETTRLADAAVEEMSRPCVQVHAETDQSDEAILEGQAASISSVHYLAFRNVGTGTALNFKFSGETSSPKAQMTDGPALAPGQVFTSNFPRNALSDPATVIAEFETLSGAKYRTETLIEGRRWVKESRFQKAT